eukprot:3907016-Rhodomonas_salina.2
MLSSHTLVPILVARYPNTSAQRGINRFLRTDCTTIADLSISFGGSRRVPGLVIVDEVKAVVQNRAARARFPLRMQPVALAW